MGLVEAEGAGRRQRTGALTHVVLDADVLLSTYNPRERYRDEIPVAERRP